MKTIDALILADYVLPMTPNTPCLTSAGIAIDKGRIIAIDGEDNLKQTFAADTVIEKRGHTLLPGFVNAHGHTAMTLLRGLADDLPLMEWLNNNIWPTEQRWVEYDFVYVGSLLACAEMIKSGTTCFHDMYFFPEATAQVVRETGIRARLGINLMELPTAWGQNVDDYLQKGLALYEDVKEEPLIEMSLAPHSTYILEDDSFHKVRQIANERGLPIHIHVHETADEITQSIDKNGCRPLEHLEKLGILGPRTMVVHMTQVTPSDFDIMQRTGTHLVHCPESNMKLASGYCPASEFIKAGINVALGTDSAASNNNLNMMSEKRTAALLAKLMQRDAQALPAETALRMATANGAKALQWDHDIGTLEVGKSADVIAINRDALASQPGYYPISDIVYSCSREQVNDVWVAGKRLLENGKLTTIDETALITRIQRWREKIMSSRA